MQIVVCSFLNETLLFCVDLYLQTIREKLQTELRPLLICYQTSSVETRDGRSAVCWGLETFSFQIFSFFLHHLRSFLRFTFCTEGLTRQKE